MGARSYAPQIGRFLQPDPVSGGSANAYGYTNGDPLDESDITGEYVENDYLEGIFAEQNLEAIELEAAREAAARAEAERKAQEAAWEAAWAAQMAAELAEREAFNAWAAAAVAGPPGAGSTWCGGEYGPCGGSGGSSSGGCSGTNACAAAGGCPSVHDPCYPHNGQTSAPVLEHSSRCRSGKEYHGRCVVNRDGGPSASECATERKIVFGGGFTGLISKAAGVIDLFAGTLVAQRCGI
jgi:uncharacterized protein RhaS with RHS repeats